MADAAQAPEGLPALVGRAAEAGATFIELRFTSRVPAWTSAALLEDVRACIAAAPRATILINDRVDIALLADAAGAHVGQDDLPVVAARDLLGPSRLLGLSTHDDVQLAAARELPLDYVAVGPMHASSTKSGHAEVVGPARLARWRSLASVPVVAIGGITHENLAAVLEAGADAVAVAGAITVGDVAASVRTFLQVLGS